MVKVALLPLTISCAEEFSLKSPLTADGPETDKEPPRICRASFEFTLLITRALLAIIVTVTFAVGRLMITSSFDPGTEPVLQFAAVSQSPLESVFQETVAAWANVHEKKKKSTKVMLDKRVKKFGRASIVVNDKVDDKKRSAL